MGNDGDAVYAIDSPEKLTRWDVKNDEFKKRRIRQHTSAISGRSFVISLKR